MLLASQLHRPPRNVRQLQRPLHNMSQLNQDKPKHLNSCVKQIAHKNTYINLCRPKKQCVLSILWQVLQRQRAKSYASS